MGRRRRFPDVRSQRHVLPSMAAQCTVDRQLVFFEAPSLERFPCSTGERFIGLNESDLWVCRCGGVSPRCCHRSNIDPTADSQGTPRLDPEFRLREEADFVACAFDFTVIVGFIQESIQHSSRNVLDSAGLAGLQP